jgi:ubiquinone/menaquinone biosynthesis C-methylase UbiE
MDNPYQPLLVTMSRFGAKGSPSDFYWAVNEAFHKAEAPLYDKLHRAMYEEEFEVWRRLITRIPKTGRKLTVLDVGCGTGLVGDFIYKLVPDRIDKIVLLDPSAAMLSEAQSKAGKWGWDTEYIHGNIDAISADRRFDLITTNSVLHHVVDLPAFCNKISSIMEPGGLFLAAQDPASDSSGNVVSERRLKIALRRRLFKRLINKIKFLFRKNTKNQPIVELITNEILIGKGVIATPMDISSIYSVTDFHVPNQPGGFGSGISANKLATWFTSLSLIEVITYNFHGLPWTDLTEFERQEERRLLLEGDQNGFELATAWIKIGE